MVECRVAHLSSHHQPVDNRIFQRECRSLADAGYQVHFIVRNPTDEVRDGVRIMAIRAPRNRLERVTVTAFQVFRRALESKARIVHLHDPELIPWGFLLRALGRTVIFDVHEDFAQAAGVRSWIPRPLRGLVARAWSGLAWFASRAFHIVIAERYYARTFPRSVKVLNYPHLERSAALRSVPRSAEPSDRIRLIYAGSVTISRGAELHARLATLLPGCLIHFCGNMSPATADAIRRASGDATIGLMGEDGSVCWEKRSNRPDSEVSTILLEGVGYYVTDRMVAALQEPWTAGLSIFPYSEHYYEKELTKFFEYMAAGLPLIVSDFPNWHAIVDGARCGLAVDPERLDIAAELIRRLHDNPAERIALGERGRAAVESRYSWTSQRQNLLDFYGSLIRPPKGSRASGHNPSSDMEAEKSL
jgi:glycosyltransferase involved in cell wall biosynthesis